MKRKPHQVIQLSIAACAFTVTASAEIQLLPAGEFRSVDGRPKGISSWVLDAALAASLIADFHSRKNRTVVDYEHQTLLSADNGQPAPASGWFKKLEWREDGLWAVDVEWTERAKEMIDAKEYLYISPVFSFDAKTGAVKRLLHAGLTNNPALDGMSEVAVEAASRLLNDETNQEKLTMELDDLLQQLRWMFNLPTLATAEEVLAEVTKASELIKAQTPAAAKAGFHIAEHITALTQQVAADPDPSKFVSVATMKSLQDELAALRKQQTDAEVDGLVVAALSDGRLLPAQEAWARGLGAKDVADLKAYIETAQPITALTSTQTKGKPVIDENGAIQLDENQLAICKQMGIKPEDYKATLAAEAETA